MKRFRAMLGWSLVCVLLLGGACGGGGSSGDSDGGGCTAPPLEGLGGFWAVQETTSSPLACRKRRPGPTPDR